MITMRLLVQQSRQREKTFHKQIQLIRSPKSTEWELATASNLCYILFLKLNFYSHSIITRGAQIFNQSSFSEGLKKKCKSKRNGKSAGISRRLPPRMPLMFFPTNWCQTSYCATWTQFGILFARGSVTGGIFSWHTALLQLLLLSLSLSQFLLVEAIWMWYSGREARAIAGTRGHVLKLLVKAIWRCYNGCEAKDCTGTRGHVPMLLLEAIWRCYNGPGSKAVPGMRTHVLMLLVEAIWRCWSGPESKAVPGMQRYVFMLQRKEAI